MKYPKVSVIISTYDRPAMLYEALYSVAKQSFRDFEVMVVDDGSNTAMDVCPQFADALPSLTCIPLELNSGYQSVPKNHGIQMCNGSYIAYLDDDNVWYPHHLATLVEEIEKGSADLVYSKPCYYGNQGNGSIDKGREASFVQISKQALEGIKQDPTLGFVDTSSILHSKGSFRRSFGGEIWNERIRRFGDWDLIMRCYQAGMRMRGLDRVTYEYRWHDTNLQKTRSPIELSMLIQKGHPENMPWKGGENIA